MQISPQRLLVVEDDVAIARTLSRTLAQRGFTVAIARSCAAARALAQRFDFAVLDLDLPDGNGVDLARHLLEQERVPAVVFFTGSSDPALLARARRIGSVVMKASGTSELLALLAQENLDAPQSRTAPSAKARSFRAHSGVTTTSAAANQKSRAR